MIHRTVVGQGGQINQNKRSTDSPVNLPPTPLDAPNHSFIFFQILSRFSFLFLSIFFFSSTQIYGPLTAPTDPLHGDVDEQETQNHISNADASHCKREDVVARKRRSSLRLVFQQMEQYWFPTIPHNG